MSSYNICHYGMSLTGRSHLKSDTVCQDANGVRILSNGWAVAAIADGLGSVKHADLGASIAVSVALDFIEKHIPLKWHDGSIVSLLQTAFNAALNSINESALKHKHELSEYDTTLTVLIYNGMNVIFGHVGDGGIIALSPFGEFSLLTEAQKGEQFNMTVPLRHGPDYWVFGKSRESVCALTMMTDGIYDFACPWKLAKNDPPIHIKFIRPFMDRNILNVNNQKDSKDAEKEIMAFFSGRDSDHITDDDMTIVGIINTDIKPKLMPEAYYAEPDWERIEKENRKRLYSDEDEQDHEAESPAQDTAAPQPVQPPLPPPAPPPRSARYNIFKFFGSKKA